MASSRKKNKKRKDAAPPSPPREATGAQDRGLVLRIGLALALLAAVAAGFYFFAGRTVRVSSGAYRGKNLLLITVDTLRADHLPLYGYRKVETPALDALGSESLVFDRAFSQVPLTLPAHTSIMTGMLPIGHGVLDNGGFSLDPKVPTLAAILKEHNYKTAAFVSAFVLDSLWRLDRGFDTYFDQFNRSQTQDLSMGEMQRKAFETEREASHWLKQNAGSPFFLWVHFYDPHEPYDPPEPYRSRYSGSEYDGEIAYTDEAIGKLLAQLRETGKEDDTLVVLTGDHGEGLGEHGEATHSIFLYNTTQHIPLLIHLPGSRRQVRVPQTVSHIDLAPTLLDWLGIQVPPEMQGRSMSPLIEGKETTPRTVFSMSLFAELHYGWSPMRSVLSGNYKYIDAPKPELYDLAADPGEQKNLVLEKQAMVRALKDRLETIVRNDTRKDQQGPAKMDPEVEEGLKALGYIGSVATSTPESRKIDPKDKIHVMEAVRESLRFLLEKKYPDAEARAQTVLQEDASIPDAHFAIAAAALSLRDYPRATDEFLKTIALRPNHTDAMQNLAIAYEKSGKPLEAEKWYLAVLKLEDRIYTQLKLAYLYLGMGEAEKARPYFLNCIRAYEEALAQASDAANRSDFLSTLGDLYFATGQMDRAEKSYREAVSLTPREPLLHFNLAQIYEETNNPGSAISEYELELEVNPSNPETLTNLGLLYRRTGNLEQSTRCFERLVQAQESPVALYLLAENYMVAGTNLPEALRLAEKSVAEKPDFEKARALLAEIRKRLR